MRLKEQHTSDRLGLPLVGPQFEVSAKTTELEIIDQFLTVLGWLSAKSWLPELVAESEFYCQIWPGLGPFVLVS